MLAAVKPYELGKLSSGRAAQLAGVTRVEFLLALGRYRAPPFALDADALVAAVANAHSSYSKDAARLIEEWNRKLAEAGAVVLPAAEVAMGRSTPSGA